MATRLNTRQAKKGFMPVSFALMSKAHVTVYHGSYSDLGVTPVSSGSKLALIVSLSLTFSHSPRTRHPNAADKRTREKD